MNGTIYESRLDLKIDTSDKRIRQLFILQFYIMQDVVLMDAISDFIHLKRDDGKHWCCIKEFAKDHDLTYQWEPAS